MGDCNVYCNSIGDLAVRMWVQQPLLESMFDARIRTVFARSADLVRRHMENATPEQRREVMFSLWDSQRHASLCEMTIDRRLRWHARVHAVYFSDDEEVTMEDLQGFLLSHTSLKEFEDDMPWSAVSAPYDVRTDAWVYAELANIHRLCLDDDMETSKFVCCGAGCDRMCCRPKPNEPCVPHEKMS